MVYHAFEAARAAVHVLGWIGAVIGYLGTELVILAIGILLIVLPAGLAWVERDKHEFSGAGRWRWYREVAWCVLYAAVGLLMAVGASMALWQTAVDLLR